jgi:hypothetical protein
MDDGAKQSSIRAKRWIRIVIEATVAALLLAIAVYWPTKPSGQLVLVCLGVLFLFGCRLLAKWPST